MLAPVLVTVVAVFFLVSPSVDGADFVPGCSFVGGQCQYSVSLGHAGQCDSAAGTGSGTTSGDPQCCETIKTDMTSLRSDIDLLKSQVTGLMNDLTKSRSSLEQAQTTLNQTETERDALLRTLLQKEAELNTTQKELANLIHRTGAEITALRSELTNMTSQVDTCRAALGLPNVDSKLSRKYLALDARKAAVYGSSPVLHSYTVISEEFEPANDYCFFFYYHHQQQ
ncbi:hypothetical protein EGW08_016085 [Elysia chlorotica]|uniref:Uncharacterized protein n=1 Tax=Elysia chlorotica TaxID=188477 RepID=A0A433T3L7_ELYCH|nr:hypothetical protein EGW08_016085 [Elysia chlorotica]